MSTARVLVVDDDLLMLDVISQILMQDGYEVLVRAVLSRQDSYDFATELHYQREPNKVKQARC